MAQTDSVSYLDTIHSSTARWQDTCFGLLNLSASQIPSGYLLDYSLTPFDDSNFNSLTSSNIDTLKNFGSFFSLQNIFTQSKVNANAAYIGNSDTLFINAHRYQRDTGYIPLLFLYQQYQKMDKNALHNGLFTITADSLRLMDVAGRSTSPYDNESFFAFTPYQSVIRQFNGVKFAVPAQFWLMPGITSVQIDFGDGVGLRTISPGTRLSINYPKNGTYVLTAQISTSSGTLIARSQIQYTQPAYYSSGDSTWTFSVAPLYTSISSYISGNQGLVRAQGTIRPLGTPQPCGDGNIFDQIDCDINPGATVTIINGCDRVFDKPIIVVEGFDLLGNVSYTDLEAQLNVNPADPSFYSTMRSQGYDFVFVSFTKNLDFIENNALVLEQIIERVNASKHGTNPNTIIGISMGGLVARYALKDMENNNITHQVGNYFSYDSPHQGANIPLSMQYLFSEMLSDMPYLKYVSNGSSLIQAFQSYAAQEMLVTYANYSGSSPGPTALNQVRAIFAQKLLTMGYPTHSTNYAVSLGRGNNTTGTTNAGNGAQWANFGPGSSLFSTTLSFDLLVNISANAFAVPVNQTATILKYTYTGLKVVSIFGIPIPVGLTIRTRNILYHGVNPYDDAPGGYENTQAQFYSALNYAFLDLRPYIILGLLLTNLPHYGHNFVPVASALDLQNQSYGASNSYQSSNMYYAIDNNVVSPGVVGAGGNTLNPSTLSPFQAVSTYTSDCAGITCEAYAGDDLLPSQYSQTSGANWNEYHEAYMSNQATQFVERKILNASPGSVCQSGFCSATTGLSGPLMVCSTGTYTVTSTYPLQFVNIAWSCPDGRLAITSGQGTPAITVSKVYSGPETVTVVLTDFCGNQTTYTLPVTSGAPVVSLNSSPNGSCSGPYQTWYLNNEPSSDGSGWQWTVGYVSSGGSLYISSPNASSTYVDVKGGGTVNLSYTDLCGVVEQNSVTIYSECPTTDVAAFSIAPNPTNGMVTISSTAPVQLEKSASVERQSAASTMTRKSIYQVRVLSQTGTILKQYAYSGGTLSTTVDLGGLANGVYTVQIFDNNTWTSQQVLLMR